MLGPAGALVRWHVGNNKWEARSQDKATDKDGLAVFEVTRSVNNNVEIFAAAALGDKQAFSPGNTYSYRDPHESWRIYAFTDRPAYRPKETVQWKAMVRRYNGSVYATPANETIAFTITGPDSPPSSIPSAESRYNFAFSFFALRASSEWHE